MKTQKICLLYQLPHKELIEKETGKSVEIEERVLTKELSQKFPEFIQGGVKLGDKVKVPKVDRKNLTMKTSYIMEADFISNDFEFDKEAKKQFDEKSKELSHGLDYEKIQHNHIRMMLQSGWKMIGLAGATYAFEFVE